MKKTIPSLLLAVMAMGFVAAGPATPLLADDFGNSAAIDMLTSGVWHIVGRNWSNYFTFSRDHTVVEGKSKHLTWVISGNKVLIQYAKYNNTLFLPLDPNGTKGLSGDGTKCTATRMEAIPQVNNGGGSSAAGNTPSPAGSSPAPSYFGVPNPPM